MKADVLALTILGRNIHMMFTQHIMYIFRFFTGTLYQVQEVSISCLLRIFILNNVEFCYVFFLYLIKMIVWFFHSRLLNYITFQPLNQPSFLRETPLGHDVLSFLNIIFNLLFLKDFHFYVCG